MVDDVLLNKAATVERCVARAREEYRKDPSTFATDLTRQDAAICNILRACGACLDIGHAIIHRERLGIPQSARDVFAVMARAGWVEPALAEALQRMVGYRDTAIHDDQALQLSITIAAIERHLDDFLAFSRMVLRPTGRTGSDAKSTD